jgi:hypothetical protein
METHGAAGQANHFVQGTLPDGRQARLVDHFQQKLDDKIAVDWLIDGNVPPGSQDPTPPKPAILKSGAEQLMKTLIQYRPFLCKIKLIVAQMG